jgi:hypothetical protein
MYLLFEKKHKHIFWKAKYSFFYLVLDNCVQLIFFFTQKIQDFPILKKGNFLKYFNTKKRLFY